MCLAIPAEVISIDQESDSAVVSLGGIKKQISLALLDEVAIGDYLLIHVGYALSKIDADEAQQTLRLFAEAGMIEARPE
ncbi:MAG TPA: HypC/HybG/HupF family hydrogenase formation chaperone [Candidatus Tenderia electrophaga]|uniref:HypC/HybG/HupF family hydrogenase formation chaperone n=1 Tax=Candidatus Tenderia electrophaga TaxID=1748243 RepID=A0A832N5X0_9GAMM|nr:HypC/HybG/HupF family hydrogenase formation chaperone [Candidatus Tenderia electrophaga]